MEQILFSLNVWPFLQWYGWREVGSKCWCASVGLTDKSVDSTPFWRVTWTSKKLTFSLDQSAVNLMVQWIKLLSLINYFNDFSPCSQIESISSIYLQQTLGFFLNLLKIFSSRAAIKRIAYVGTNFVPIDVHVFIF